MPTEAPPAPPAPTQTPPPAPAPLKIPSLQDILGTKPQTPAPPTGKNGPGGLPPTPTPAPAAKTDDLPNTRILPDLTKPTVEGPDPNDDGSDIDTQIIPPVHPTGKKPEDFARERRESRAKSGKADELQKQLDKHLADAAALKLELETERAARQKEKEELENFKTLASTREKDIADLNTKYFENFKPQYAPGMDEEVVKSHTDMLTTLKDKLPAYVPKPNGQERLLFDKIIQDPAKLNGMENAMQYYIQAQAEGRSDVMDLAVNTVANALGADVEIHGIGDPRNRVLDSNDPFFRDVEEAIKRATPHLGKKIGRLRFIQENEPKLAEERFDARQKSIQSELTGAFSISQEQIAAALQKDKTDSMALFTAVLNSAPALREQVNAAISTAAADLSSIPDQLLMPPLRKNDAVSVAEHRKLYHERRERLGQLQRFAIIGKMCGPILAALIADRDEAAARADAAAALTNPGDTRSSSKPPEQQVDIPTTIMPPLPGSPQRS